MHNGRFQTLDAVIAVYAAGNTDRKIAATAHTPQESNILIAILQSLTNHQFLTNRELGPWPLPELAVRTKLVQYQRKQQRCHSHDR
ncbi:MAG: hypothetical protein CMP98_08515 [Gammaproteobacteria bacterium]|nr:hypothetical protein [Gammaproteobacteria bacterium]OUU09045.1 MAG: hypothetical protein CBB94_08740 [Gammaproteobacteria bacterium TMED34]|tara:strand:- start:1507 stop:1764 length:258 start_codon:yes stop_codon:yes gene_type:complete